MKKWGLCFSLSVLLLSYFVLSACNILEEMLLPEVLTPTQEPTNTPQPSPSPTITMTVTATQTSTRTPRPTQTPSPSPTPNLTATAQIESMTEKVQEYANAGYIDSTKGSYERLTPFSDEWAQIDWYSWTYIKPDSFRNFIIRMDVTWESASKTPNSSGCGIVFRVQPNTDHYLVYLDVDGYVYTAYNIADSWAHLGRGYYSKAQVNGSANLALIVTGNHFLVLVNDKLIKRITGLEGKLIDGRVGYTVISGSNKEFGTRCNFDNIDFWIIDTQ